MAAREAWGVDCSQGRRVDNMLCLQTKTLLPYARYPRFPRKNLTYNLQVSIKRVKKATLTVFLSIFIVFFTF
ncbi:MAG: hypothetical protein LBI04_03250, partial [Treponema sp.]|nr:hypothetical protein [Treponema sp.]